MSAGQVETAMRPTRRGAGWTAARKTGGLGAAGVALALALGCSGEKATEPVVRTVTCGTDLTVGANQVGLECVASGGSVLVKVVIGGPSTATDIYAVKFDLVFDSVVVGYQGDAGLGTFLTKGGGTARVLADVMSNDPDRLVAAVSLQGSVSGVAVTNAKETVAGFLFTGLNPGSTTIQFENGAVVDDALDPIAGIAFVSTLQIDVE
jgi:hypothetical protein